MLLAMVDGMSWDYAMVCSHGVSFRIHCPQSHWTAVVQSKIINIQFRTLSDLGSILKSMFFCAV